MLIDIGKNTCLFFDTPDAVTAYWAGYIVNRASMRFTPDGQFSHLLIGSEGDKRHLSQLVKLLHPHAKWIKDTHLISVRYPDLPDWLREWGIVRQDFLPPYWMADDLLPHYLRGMIESTVILQHTPMLPQLTCQMIYPANLRWFCDALTTRLGYTGTIRHSKIYNGKITIFGQRQINELSQLVQYQDNPQRNLIWEHFLDQ